MKTQIVTILAGLSLSGAAFAHPREHRGPPETCGDEITDAQRAQLRDEHLKFADERIDLEAKEKHARVELMEAVSGKASDAAIRKAALAAAEASSKVRVAEEVNRTEVLLKVFKPEQRDKAVHCLMGPPHGHFAFGKGFGPPSPALRRGGGRRRPGPRARGQRRLN